VVTFVTRILTHYRVSFHEQVRHRLSLQGVDYRLIHGQPDAEEAAKGDLATLPWATVIRNRALFGRGKLVWQPIYGAVRKSDLIVLGQENQLLVNYPLQMMPRGLRPRLALWGHGRNFQARNPHSSAERWKRFWAPRVDWWFAYTDETRRHVEELGFPAERITVFNNAVDTSEVRALITAVTPAGLDARRAELGIQGGDVGVFVGGLYDDKRLTFLVDAADRIRARVPDFVLIVAGGGEQLPLLRELAATRPWIKVMGPRFGIDKVELMLLGRLFMMPGLVGLAVVDAGAAGLPTVTTAFPYHSPEIAYVKHGVSGVIVPEWKDTRAYAEAVTSLLKNPARLAEMRAAAQGMANGLTIEAMADRFAEGVLKALAA
jgi:glycosyltransferase involved in cell wall biosynthesis